MQSRTRITALLGVTIILLCLPASAVRVGLLAVFPDGKIYQKCIDAEPGASGFDILEQSGLNITWSPPTQYGHKLCAINGTGCPVNNCYCNRDSMYWNFYLKRIGYEEWEYPDPIESKFDGGNTCQEHYCAKEGDILGLKYSVYRDTPFTYRFQDICTDNRTNDIHVKKNIPPPVVGHVTQSDIQKTFSFGVLGAFFVIALLIGTIRYVKKR